jgi:NADH-quinone oxidoreductase subunit G
MPKLMIDDRKIEVAPGVKVIAAAEQAGIVIPRFCYHPALGSVGACRLCAVKFLDGPVRGLQMSCMVEARDGMVISSTDDEAVDFRRFVIELLMLNHPHDCPVCDEGGYCLLQDETISGGHAMRRSMGKKRTHRDQYIGELVQHEMNRCIQCYRCQRFYQDYCGYRDFGVMGSASRVYFGRYADGALENPFSGNLIDICPTGVLTDKPARFKGRRWDFQRAPSICIHCSLGCSITVNARYRELVRVEARYNADINGHFICDRGRYGFAFANHPDRPRQARINGRDTSYEEAIQTTTQRLSEIARTLGPDSIACLSSSRAGVETQMSLKFLTRSQGWRQPGCFVDRSEQNSVTAAVGRLTPERVVSLGEIEKADLILVIGVDPILEAPMLALAMRQAQRAGAGIIILNPQPVSVPFAYDHRPISPDDLCSTLQKWTRSISSQTRTESHFVEKHEEYRGPETPSVPCPLPPVDSLLQNSRRPMIVCGTNIVGTAIIHAAADLARDIHSDCRFPGLFYVLPGPNAFGAAFASAGGKSFSDILPDIETGNIKALILVEADPIFQFPDQERVKNAVKQLDLLVVLDYVPSRSVGFAGQSLTEMVSPAPLHVMIPTLTHFETQASFINQEGRLQQTTPVHVNGLPMSQLTGGKHPPRKFRSDVPGAGARAAWQVLSELEAVLSSMPADSITFADIWYRIGLAWNISVENRTEIPGNLRILSTTVESEPMTEHYRDD